MGWGEAEVLGVIVFNFELNSTISNRGLSVSGVVGEGHAGHRGRP